MTISLKQRIAVGLISLAALTAPLAAHAGGMFRVEVYNHTGERAEIRGPNVTVDNGRRGLYSGNLADCPTYRAYRPGTDEQLASARKCIDGNITIRLRR